MAGWEYDKLDQTTILTRYDTDMIISRYWIDRTDQLIIDYHSS